MMRQQQSLNSFWEYTINGVPQPPVRVPYSALCVGDSECTLRFGAKVAPHAELCFEGITYRAAVELNGVQLGVMGPYSRYRYDVTSLLRAEGNLLRVSLKDMNLPFGPSEGWENYGGIIRDVYIIYTDRVYVADAVWRTRTEEPYDRAECSVKVEIGGAKDAPISASLTDRRGVVVAEASGQAAEGSADLCMRVERPELWSPDTPNLYVLTVRAGDDEICERVGIKDFRIRGQRFWLNGKPLFLKGLNRHDMWGDCGHTLSREQMEKDMRMIKATGCNYVRLVHYPHHPHIVELADEIGLLVSEEPGLWWSDMHNPEVVETALDVLRRVVIRDRNRCSVAFWLAFNECVFTSEFLEASSSLCRSLDPDRPVSGANAMAKEMTKELFGRHGFDFYTRHPYTWDIDRFREEAEYLTDMPLVFTEWGGYFVFENGCLFEDSLEAMIDAWHKPDGEGVIAGCAYWCWADMYEFGRGLQACSEGILNEGLVDIYRNPRENLARYTRIMHGFDQPVLPPQKLAVHEGVRSRDSRFVPLALPVDAGTQQALYARTIERATPQAGYVHKKARRLTVGPRIPQAIAEADGIPLAPETQQPVVIAADAPYTIEVRAQASRVHFIGNVSLPWGYPIYGRHGEDAARYVLHYADGTVQAVELRNGIELTTCLGQQGPSRINPVAPALRRAAEWSYDENWEHYVAQHFTVDAASASPLEYIEVIVRHEECALLLYAVTLEQTDLT